MRLRAPAFQRRSRQRGDPAGVQGKAALPVHAPLVPEDRLLSAQRGDAWPRGLPAAEGFVSGAQIVGWVGRSETHRLSHHSRWWVTRLMALTRPTAIEI